MITLVSSPKQHMRKHMQHSVYIWRPYYFALIISAFDMGAVRYQRKVPKYLLARWYWGLHVCSIKKQVSVFDDDTLFGLPKARPTYCQCAKLFKNRTF